MLLLLCIYSPTECAHNVPICTHPLKVHVNSSFHRHVLKGPHHIHPQMSITLHIRKFQHNDMSTNMLPFLYTTCLIDCPHMFTPCIRECPQHPSPCFPNCLHICTSCTMELISQHLSTLSFQDCLHNYYDQLCFPDCQHMPPPYFSVYPHQSTPCFLECPHISRQEKLSFKQK